MRTLGVIFLIACSPIPVSAQSSSAPLLRVGTTVRYQPNADSSWTLGRVILGGNCLVLAAQIDLDSAAAHGGFRGILFSAVRAVEVQQGTSWVRVSESELSSVRACKTEP